MGGTSLADLLKAAQVKRGALEVVFYGADQGEEVVRKDTPLEVKFNGTFARSMSLDDAMNPANLLCYEMNGSPLPAANGFPVRLIAPGWFGVANVKWLRRIELRDTRYLGRFMGRDYVTMREVERDGKTTVTETSVGRMLLKSAPAKVISDRRALADRRDGMGAGAGRGRRGQDRQRAVDEGNAGGEQVRVCMASLASRLVADTRRAHCDVAGDRYGRQYPASDG